MRLLTTLVVSTVLFLIGATSGTASKALAPSGQAHQGPLHIDKLRAWIAKENGLRWVRVQATVCLRSEAEAMRLAPDEFRLTQYIVYKGRWTPTLILIKPSPWIVSFGDSWSGKACGPVKYRDLFEWPEGFAGFGSTTNCFGVGFSIKARAWRTTKRGTIQCGSR
jgi:hypothetical protein